ncbi:putative J domain-containing protein3 [Vanrija pseudolonga]|uniref:Purtative J domain-containing protein3 n=1 Tax=Vanrija pseudolonga TaxID=143232 RepID=A0AAF1BEM8_9TREE|nr:purtative J domain-containing protein3 [Vanrija pseudolonga]
MSTLPQNIQSTATAEDIRAAYRRESLKTHPDRLSPKAPAEERRRATERFQAVADAYYVLSDPHRRAEYDRLFRSRPASAFTSPTADEDEQDQASSNFFAEFARFFTEATNASASGSGAPDSGVDSGASTPAGGEKPTPASDGPQAPGASGRTRRPDANRVFGDVFEELLEPEVAHVHKTWSWVGGAAGAALGYIVANIPGAVAGGFAGNRIGAIRDAKGKSVAEVFARLPSSQKAQILKALAFKVLGSMQ